MARISDLLFVFSTGIDESTDWQSDHKLDDSTKPRLVLAVQLFTKRAGRKRVQRGRRDPSVCVFKKKILTERRGVKK